VAGFDNSSSHNGKEGGDERRPKTCVDSRGSLAGRLVAIGEIQIKTGITRVKGWPVTAARIEMRTKEQTEKASATAEDRATGWKSLADLEKQIRAKNPELQPLICGERSK
jgi:hypothetical protein